MSLACATAASKVPQAAPLTMSTQSMSERPGIGLRELSHSIRFPEKVRAVCFDFDGTVARTEAFHRCALLWAKESALGRTLKSADVARVASTAWNVPNQKSCEVIAESLRTHYGISVTAEHINNLRQAAFNERFLPVEQLLDKLPQLLGMRMRFFNLMMKLELVENPGVRSLLQGLQSRNIPATICTGSSKSVVWPMLQALKLYGYFAEQQCVFMDHYAADKGKPNPTPYLIATQQLQSLVPGLQPKEILACEDTLGGTMAARRAQLGHVLLVPTANTESTKQRAAELILSEPSPTEVILIPSFGPSADPAMRVPWGLSKIELAA